MAIANSAFFITASAATYPYQGSEGVDFDANLSAWWRYKGTQILNIATEISSLDFGTFHSYPQSWGQSDNVLNWGTQWIKGTSLNLC